MLKKLTLCLALLAVSMYSVAAVVSTGKGRIVSTQGHTNPDCRVVLFKSNDTGEQKHFRIAATARDDSVQPVIMSALISKRDVEIHYEADVTTGCGTEPKIMFVTLY